MVRNKATNGNADRVAQDPAPTGPGWRYRLPYRLERGSLYEFAGRPLEGSGTKDLVKARTVATAARPCQSANASTKDWPRCSKRGGCVVQRKLWPGRKLPDRLKASGRPLWTRSRKCARNNSEPKRHRPSQHVACRTEAPIDTVTLWRLAQVIFAARGKVARFVVHRAGEDWIPD